MGQIELSEANDLLKKLFDERVPVVAFFVAHSGARIKFRGFVAGAGRDVGLFITPARLYARLQEHLVQHLQRTYQ